MLLGSQAAVELAGVPFVVSMAAAETVPVTLMEWVPAELKEVSGSTMTCPVKTAA